MDGNRYHHLGWHHGIEVYEAAFSRQTFSRHAHAGFAIGAIQDGVGGYVCRGARMVLPTGTLSLMNPEEPHTGHAAAGHLRYTMLYVSEAATGAVLDTSAVRGFRSVAPVDAGGTVGRALSDLAARLNAPAGPDCRLAVEEAVHAALTMVFARHGGARLRPAGREPAAVARMKERIAAGVETGERLTVAELAAEVGLHPATLIRSCARATGLTPHAHVVRRRLAEARRLLLAGMPAAEVAVTAGFCDQAHMIRQFRRHLGVTPGALIRH